MGRVDRLVARRKTATESWFRRGISYQGATGFRSMQAGTTDADRTIAVLSPRYLASVYGSGRMAGRMGQRLSYGTKRKLLVVRVEECDRPGLLAGIVGVDLFGISEAMSETRLRNMVSAAVSGRGKPSVKPGFPGTGRVMPRAVRFPGTYQQAYAEVAQALLSIHCAPWTPPRRRAHSYPRLPTRVGRRPPASQSSILRSFLAYSRTPLRSHRARRKSRNVSAPLEEATAEAAAATMELRSVAPRGPKGRVTVRLSTRCGRREKLARRRARPR